MSNRYSSGKFAIAVCDRCGFQFRLDQLKKLTIKQKVVDILVCPECWEEDQPQLSLGMYPVYDPQALENPRPDNTYWQAGYTGLQLNPNNPANPNAKANYGVPSDGSRITAWGWAPVGLNNQLALPGLEDTLQSIGSLGTVTVVIT